MNEDAIDNLNIRSFAERVGEAVTGGGFAMEGYWVWCGSVGWGEDGRWHMFAARWPKAYPFFQGYAAASEIVRATADSPAGPFRFEEVVLGPRDKSYWDGRMAHNPYLLKPRQGWALFYCGVTYDEDATPEEMWALNRRPGRNGAMPPWMDRMRGGVAIADSLTGPWRRPDEPLNLSLDPAQIESRAVNVSALETPEGRCMLVYRFSGRGLVCVTADQPAGPYLAGDMHLIYDYSRLPYIEDPCIFRLEGCYQMLAKDARGHWTGEPFALVHFLSRDGRTWVPAPRPKACSRRVRWDDGKVREQGNLERPYVLFRSGQPAYLYAATSNGTHSEAHPAHYNARDTWCLAIRLT